MDTIKRISCWINHRYSLTLMLSLFLVVLGFFWVFNFSSFPISNPEIMKLSDGTGLLDTMFFYSPHKAYSALTSYGAEGRKFYLAFIAADFIFIVFYSFAFSFLMTITTISVCGKKSLWSLLNVLPICIGFFDGLENICILAMLKTFPANHSAIETLSGIATLSKWLLTIVTISLLVYGGFIVLSRSLGFKHCVTEEC